MKELKKYYLSFSVAGHGITADGPRFRQADWIEAEGNDLDEVLDSATVHFVDQDGGEAGFEPADRKEFQDIIQGVFEALDSESVRTPEIYFKLKRDFGRERFYPDCHRSKILTELAGKKTLTREELEVIKRLGYRISLKAEELRLM